MMSVNKRKKERKWGNVTKKKREKKKKEKKGEVNAEIREKSTFLPSPEQSV